MNHSYIENFLVHSHLAQFICNGRIGHVRDGVSLI